MSVSGSPEPDHSPPQVDESQAAESSKPELFTIKVQDDQHQEISFKLKSKTRFQKVMDKWCMTQSKDPLSVRFYTHDGQRIIGHETFAEVSSFFFFSSWFRVSRKLADVFDLAQYGKWWCCFCSHIPARWQYWKRNTALYTGRKTYQGG